MGICVCMCDYTLFLFIIILPAPLPSSMNVFKAKLRVGEIVEQLRALTALLEEQNSAPNTHVRWLTAT